MGLLAKIAGQIKQSVCVGLTLGVLGAGSAAALGQDSSSPSMEDIFDTSIPDEERVLQPNLQLPSTLDQVPTPVSADERAELSAWVKWMVLKNLPPNFEDNRKWNKQKEVFDGIHLRREGLKIETKRKYKTVKHGTWTRYTVQFLNPEDDLIVDIQKIDFTQDGRIDIRTRVEAPLKLFGRLTQFQRDVQWISLSVNATATVEMTMDCQVNIHVNTLKFPPDVEFSPVVTNAKVQLKEFDVERISQIHGTPAEVLGKGIREVLDEKLEEYDEKLVEKMNREIIKQKSKLKLSLSDWLEKRIGAKAKTPK